MSFLLESVEGGAVRGRYSIIGLDPDLIWRAEGARAEINRTARRRADGLHPLRRAAARRLARLIAESRIELPDELPPMAAGVFGYLGYDMVRLMEELPRPIPTRSAIPDAILMRPTVIVVFDAVTDRSRWSRRCGRRRGVSAKAALARATERLAAVVDGLDRAARQGRRRRGRRPD